MKQTITSRNLPYYAGILLLFLLLKYGYTLSTNDHLLFLLSPINTGIEIITDSKATYTVAEGFEHSRLSIIIDKSCSGFNFCLLSFTLLTLSTIHFYKTTNHKLLACATLLI